MGIQVNPWEEILGIYAKMIAETNNPSNLAGNTSNPVFEIEQELNSANPDWKKISADLDQLQVEMNEMVDIAVANKLKPANDPNFIKDLLDPTDALVGKLKSEMGTPQFTGDFDNFVEDLGYIRQHILK
jgi:hypothetical protein